MHTHWLFTLNVGAHLVASMSSLVSFSIAIYEATRKKKFETWAFFAIGALCLIVSFDQAWNDEHRNSEVLKAQKSAAIDEREFWKAQSYLKDEALRSRDQLLAQNYGALIGQQSTSNLSQASLSKLSTKIAEMNAGCFRPDRRLSLEDRKVLFTELENISERIKKENKIPTYRLYHISADDEARRFADELRPIFDHAGWTPKFEFPQNADAATMQRITEENGRKAKAQQDWLFANGMTEGVMIFDVKWPMSYGNSVWFALQRVGISGDQWPLNKPHQMPQLDDDDTITIWVGYKHIN
jgi:hypothetical protein